MKIFSWFSHFMAHRRMARKGMLNQSSYRVNKNHSFFHWLLHESSFPVMVMLLLVAFVSFYAIVNPMYLAPVPRIVEGQQASITIYARFNFAYEDKAATEKLREQKEKLQPKYYRVKTSKAAFKTFAAELIRESDKRSRIGHGSFSYDYSDTPAGRMIREMPVGMFNVFMKIILDPRLASLFQQKVFDAISTGLLRQSDKELLVAQKNGGVRVIDVYGRSLFARPVSTFDTPQEAAKKITAELLMHFAPADREQMTAELSSAIERAMDHFEMTYDAQYTEKMKTAALNMVRPIMIEVQKGELLLKRNTNVTAADCRRIAHYTDETLQRRNEMLKNTHWVDLFKSLLFCVIALTFSVIYMEHIHPEVLHDRQISILILFVVMLAILLNMFSSMAFNSLSERYTIPPRMYFLALPLAFAPMALASSCGVRVALYAGVYVSLIASVSSSDSFVILFTGLIVSGISAHFVYQRFYYRRHFFIGAFVTSITTLVIGLYLMWRENSILPLMPWLVLVPLLTGIYTSALVQMTFPLIENLFDVTTNMSLISYDYNHVLLKRMQIEAPGTYHHSVVVSMLAEAAAKEIGANPLKARVCALFHDVGKLSHPEYFIENSSGEDKHKDLKPQVSAMIILNHVREGLELAKKYKLKKPMRDAIQQHHGTDLVYFFYKQALDSGEACNEQDFRYDGPAPESKEIAIVSLADACEAASRSLSKTTHGKLEELVTEIIMKRLRKGQLDNAKLTFQELSMIRESFVKTLTSMHHTRIEYPKEEESNEDDLFMDQTERNTTRS